MLYIMRPTSPPQPPPLLLLPLLLLLLLLPRAASGAELGDACPDGTNTLCDTPDTGLACLGEVCTACAAWPDNRSGASGASNKGCGDPFVCAFVDTDVNATRCLRAPLFSAQTAGLTWAGAVFLFMGSSLAAGGGLGGGGIFVPLLILRPPT